MCINLRLLEYLCSISAGFAFFFRIFCDAASVYLKMDNFVYFVFFFLFYIEFILMQKAYLDSASSVVTD